ncbi:MAG TPA: hypothetical protein VGR78_02535 [Verrucomicrobiae bacterium]|nr:hypothetical protein [Verrucomicrobiae bacterium]
MTLLMKKDVALDTEDINFFVVSFAACEVLWHRYHRTATAASVVFGFTFLISLTALPVVCFFLQRSARLLAVIGWITAFVLFWYAALT